MPRKLKGMSTSKAGSLCFASHVHAHTLCHLVLQTLQGRWPKQSSLVLLVKCSCQASLRRAMEHVWLSCRRGQSLPGSVYELASAKRLLLSQEAQGALWDKQPGELSLICPPLHSCLQMYLQKQYL